MPTPEQITRHHGADPDTDWVERPPPTERVEIVAYNPCWPARYRALADDIRSALGAAALAIEHVGSTAVPGLAAKDVIDIDLTVADPRTEQAYLPILRDIGYRLTVREPNWHQHRCLRHDDPRVNLHVFGPDCPETIRHRMFRDWLSCHPDDRIRYEQAKRSAVPGDGHVMDYNARKQPVIREIYDRIFRAEGLL